MRRNNQITGLILAFLILGLASHYAKGKIHAISTKSTSIYCHTSEPNGLVYLNLRTGSKRWLHSIIINGMFTGPDGYLAVEGQQTIRIYQHGRYILGIPVIRGDIIGWLGRSIIYREDKLLTQSQKRKMGIKQNTVAFDGWNHYCYRINPLSRVKKFINLPSNVDAVGSLSNGWFEIMGGKHWTFLTLRSPSGKQLAAWRAYDDGNGCLILDNRFLVIDMTSYIWIVDTQLKRERITRSYTPYPIFCSGNRYGELIIAKYIYKHHISNNSASLNISATEIFSLDVRTFVQRLLFKLNGQYDPVGLAEGGSYLLLIRPYAAVGPGALVEIQMSTHKVHTILPRVYECVISH